MANTSYTYTLNVIAKGQDHLSQPMHQASASMGVLTVAMGNLAAQGIAALTGGLVRAGQSAVGMAADYETTLNMLAANTGATGEQLDKLDRLAQQLGSDLNLPSTSAKDAAAAMFELSKAGMSVEQSMGAVRGVLELATAANVSEAQAAEINANMLNMFALAADESSRVTDLLATTANKSSVELLDVADSAKMAGAVWASFQGDTLGSAEALNQLMTAIGLLGNAGIKGSDAGTSLKQALLMLAAPAGPAEGAMKAVMYAAAGTEAAFTGLDDVLNGSKKERTAALQAMGDAAPDIANLGNLAYDAAGKMRSLPEMIDLLGRATSRMTAQQKNDLVTTIFGADAARAMLILLDQGTAAFEDFEATITAGGGAAALADAQTQGLAGSLEGFKSVLEGVQLASGQPWQEPLAKAVRSAAEVLSEHTDDIAAFSGRLAGMFDGMMTRIPMAIERLDRFWGSGFARHKTSLTAIESVKRALNTVMTGDFTGMFGFYEDGVVPVALYALHDALASIPGLLPGIQTVGATIQGVITKSTPYAQQFTALWGSLVSPNDTQAAMQVIEQFGNETGRTILETEATIRAAWGKIVALFDTAKTAIPAALASIVAQATPYAQRLGAMFDTARSIAAPAIAAIPGLLAGLPATIGGIVDQVTPYAQRLGGIFDTVKTTIQPAIDAIPGLLAGLPATIGGIVDQTLPLIQPLVDKFTDLGSRGLDGLRQLASGDVQGGLSTLGGLLKDVATQASGGNLSLAALASNGVGTLLDKLRDSGVVNDFASALGLSGKQADDLDLLMLNLSNTATGLGGLFNSVAQGARDIAGAALDAAGPLGGMLLDNANILIGMISERAIPLLTDFTNWIGPNLKGAIDVVAPILTGLADVGLALVEGALARVFDLLENAQPVLDAMGQWLEGITGGWENLARGAQVVGDALGWVADAVRGQMNVDKKLWGGEGGGGGATWGEGGGGGATIRLPGMATGGNVTAAGLALVGERGPELLSLPRGAQVSPLSGGGNALSAGGGGMVYAPVFNVTINAGMYETDSAMGGKLVSILRAEARRAGGLDFTRPV